MATSQIRPVVVWVLVIGLLVSGGLATKVELDKRRLAASYVQAKAALAQLEQERTHLSQELVQARQTLEDQTGELVQLQARLEQTEQEVSRLRLEQTRLQYANMTLAEQLAAASQAKQVLEAKLASVKELKTAIRDLKHKQWQQRWAAWLEHIDAQRQRDDEQLSQGNRGLVVRDGVSTLGSVTKLQVRVLEPQSP